MVIIRTNAVELLGCRILTLSNLSTVVTTEATHTVWHVLGHTFASGFVINTIIVTLAICHQVRCITRVVVNTLSVSTLIRRRQWPRMTEVNNGRFVAYTLAPMVRVVLVTYAMDHIGSIVNALATSTTWTVSTLWNIALFAD